MEDNSNKLSFFFLGLGIGVAAGVLFAPKAGDETRQLLRAKADEGGEYLRRRGEDLKGQAASLVEKGKETVIRKKESLSAAVDAGRQAYRESVEPGPERL